MENDNEKLITALSNKDIKAFEEFFFKYHGRLVMFANKFTGDIQVAKDIVQDAFLIFWDKAGELTIASSPKAYLFQAVRNSCLNYQRHLGVRNTAMDEIGHSISNIEKQAYSNYNDPYFSLLELEMEQRIADVVNSMPDKCQQVFKLSRQQHLKNKEIAEKLNISVKMVEKHISKALHILRHELADYLAAIFIFFLSNL